MSDEIRALLESAAAAPRRQPPMPQLRTRARRSRILRAATVVLSAGLLGVAGAGILMTANDIERATPPATTASPSETRPEPTSTESEEEPNVRDLEWPDPFVPATVPAGDRRLMPVVLPDKTAFTLSYPSELELARLGVQVTLSYSFEQARQNAPHDIIFIRGQAPEGLLDPDPIETFDDGPFPASLHAVTFEHLRGNPPFAVVFDAQEWTVVATVPRREDAETVAEHLHPSVTDDGWPSVLASGPLQLSEFFGEARGPHLEIHDKNPLWDVADSGEDFEYIVMGPTNCNPARDGAEASGGNWYGSRCLTFAGGGLSIFVSVYGPEEFVRAIVRGIALES